MPSGHASGKLDPGCLVDERIVPSGMVVPAYLVGILLCIVEVGSRVPVGHDGRLVSG